VKIYNSIDEYNQIKENLSNLVYVPTMGNLHYGHASLIDIAKQFNQEVIATIYINKLQFNDKNDYLNYPKTLDKDLELLKQHGCDHLILPDDSILDNIKTIKAPSKANKLCGLNRPGHFDGVLTILNKFFNIINPNILILGKKDYQQFILVKDFIKDKNLNIKTIGVETIRERNGLAYSSRNTLLSNNNKSIASMLYKVLKDIELNKDGLSNDLLNSQIKYLTSIGFELDYLAVCDTESLEQSLDIYKKDLLVAIAAKLNNVRLIDNIVLTKL
jgi:pantoate--beta-alanine ligase